MRPRDCYGPDPVETDNGQRPDDGDQDVDQSPLTDYSQGVDGADS